jgi:hypothetical protein
MSFSVHILPKHAQNESDYRPTKFTKCTSLRVSTNAYFLSRTSNVHILQIPTPREASPEPNLNQSADFARPCPHCLPGNPYGWICPQPIPDPVTDPDHAWHFDDGTPPGHLYCGNCENLLASRAPTTTKCDMCQVSFCGVGVQGRCIASPLQSQHPHGMSDAGDLIQSSEVYECFYCADYNVRRVRLSARLNRVGGYRS